MGSLQSSAYFRGRQREVRRRGRRVCFSHVISHFGQEAAVDKRRSASVGNTKRTIFLQVEKSLPYLLTLFAVQTPPLFSEHLVEL